MSLAHLAGTAQKKRCEALFQEDLAPAFLCQLYAWFGVEDGLAASWFAGDWIKEQAVTVAGVTEVEHVVQATSQGVEGLIADTTQLPVVLDEAQDGGLVGDRMIDEVLFSVR